MEKKIRQEETPDRMLALAQILFLGGTVTSRLIRERWDVSKATAKRDLVRLEVGLPLVVEQRSERAPKRLRWSPESRS